METKKEKAEKIIKILKKAFPNPKTALNYSNSWEIFVSVILSAQSTDKKVNEVTKNLFKKYKNIKDYKNALLSEFQQEIKSIGLYKNKAKYIISSAKIIDEKYNGKIPNSMQELLKLPGIGRKSANIILGNVYNISEGIAVDTHVARLSKLFGLTSEKNPLKIEKDLMMIVPKKDWMFFNHAMVLYGRKYCPARHKHTNCPLKEFIKA